MDNHLLDVVACPVCYGKLTYDKQQQELICKVDGLAYPIRDNIPVLLETEARKISDSESL